MDIAYVQSLQCEITTFCNARCPHCPRFTPEGTLISSLNLDHWNTEIIFKNLQIDKMINLRNVVIEGDKGDPVMHPHLLNIIEYFLSAKSKPTVSITTNGSIQKTSFWKKLGSLSDRLEVRFSIDGLEDTNHIYRVRTNYNKIVENYKAFISAGGNAIWKFIVWQHNQHQIQQAKNIAKDAGFLQIQFVYPFINRFLGEYKWEIFDNQTFLGILSPPDLSYNQVVNNSEVFKKRDIQKYDKIYSEQYVCPNLRDGHFYITYDYYLFPCCMMHNVMHEKGAPYHAIKRLLQDEKDINLGHNNFDTILKSNFYLKSLEQHFINGYHHPICHNSCHDKIVEQVRKIKVKNNF